MRFLRHAILLVAVLLAYGWTLADVSAQEAEAADREHSNHVAVFVGATTPTAAKGETSFTLGIDYERRLTDLIGVIGLGDFTFGDHERTALIGGQVAFHFSGLRLAVGPGFEVVEEVHDAHTPAGEGGSTHGAEFVMRASVLYEFDVGQWAIGPTLSVDAIGETKTSIVYGLSVGRGF